MSSYSKRMAQLSARIFGDLNIQDRLSKNHHLIQRIQLKPVTKQVEYTMNYYPRHQELDYLFLKLRDYGLYRDEHRDFNDEMERLRRLRGKGKKLRDKKEQRVNMFFEAGSQVVIPAETSASTTPATTKKK